MKKIEMWEAEDGKFFETETECSEYEKKISSQGEITYYLEKEFCFAIGYSRPECIAKYIIENLEKFNLKFRGED